MLQQSAARPDAPALPPCLDGPALAAVVARLAAPHPQTAALAACVLAACCARPRERALAAEAGAARGLLALLADSTRQDTQAAALEALAALLPHDPSACAAALAHPGVAARLHAALRCPEPRTRLLAAGCATTLSRAAGCREPEALQRAALPVLLRLLAHPATRPAVPPVLAALLERSGPLQKAAADADVVRQLAALLAAEVPQSAAGGAAGGEVAAAGAGIGPAVPASAGMGAGCGSQSREGCLRALASLCLEHEECRKQLLDAKVSRHLARALDDPSPGVRSAAALLVRALGRCVRTLRGGLLEGELPAGLVRLLRDGSGEVRSAAAAAVCNLVLDFSAAKAGVLAAGGLQALAELAAPPHVVEQRRPGTVGTAGCVPPAAASSEQQPAAAAAAWDERQRVDVRPTAVWALANMAYRAEAGVRREVMQVLPWPRFRSLLADSDPWVACHALALLRNLTAGGPGEPCGQVHKAAELAAVGEWAAGQLLPVLEERILAATQGPSPIGATTNTVATTNTTAAATLDASAASAPHSPAADSNAGLSCTPIVPDSEPHPTAAPAATATTVSGSEPQPAALAAEHALYTLANWLTAGRAHQAAVAARRPLLAAVAGALRAGAGSDAGGAALPAVWALINLTLSPEPRGDGALAARCRQLAELGVEGALEGLLTHGSEGVPLDVQERARTALDQLRKGLAAGTADSC